MEGQARTDSRDGRPVIVLSRLNGSQFALNPDLFERVEATPDTVVTLCDGTRYVVAESVGEVVAAVRTWRCEIVASARELAFAAENPGAERPALAPVAAVGRHTGPAPSYQSDDDEQLHHPVVPLRRRRRP